MATVNTEGVTASAKNITQHCSNRKAKKAKRRRYRKSLRKMPKSEILPPQIGDASHCGWFWRNYYNALDWSERHQIAYWKSRSVALEYENTLLHQYVQNMQNNEHFLSCDMPNTSTAMRKYGHFYRQKCQQEELQEVESDEDEGEGLEFQVNEEMMQFFEQSIRHKMERDKQRRNESKQTSVQGEFQLPSKQMGTERREDMRRIYGKATPMIMGMEAALQLSFDRNCDSRQPKLWPNLPLKM